MFIVCILDYNPILLSFVAPFVPTLVIGIFLFFTWSVCVCVVTAPGQESVKNPFSYDWRPRCGHKMESLLLA